MFVDSGSMSNWWNTSHLSVTKDATAVAFILHSSYELFPEDIANMVQTIMYTRNMSYIEAVEYFYSVVVDGNCNNRVVEFLEHGAESKVLDKDMRSYSLLCSNDIGNWFIYNKDVNVGFYNMKRMQVPIDVEHDYYINNTAPNMVIRNPEYNSLKSFIIDLDEDLDRNIRVLYPNNYNSAPKPKLYHMVKNNKAGYTVPINEDTLCEYTFRHFVPEDNNDK